jgi:hypothetical protein
MPLWDFSIAIARLEANSNYWLSKWISEPIYGFDVEGCSEG